MKNLEGRLFWRLLFPLLLAGAVIALVHVVLFDTRYDSCHGVIVSQWDTNVFQMDDGSEMGRLVFSENEYREYSLGGHYRQTFVGPRPQIGDIATKRTISLYRNTWFGRSYPQELIIIYWRTGTALPEPVISDSQRQLFEPDQPGLPTEYLYQMVLLLPPHEWMCGRYQVDETMNGRLVVHGG